MIIIFSSKQMKHFIKKLFVRRQSNAFIINLIIFQRTFLKKNVQTSYFDKGRDSEMAHFKLIIIFMKRRQNGLC